MRTTRKAEDDSDAIPPTACPDPGVAVAPPAATTMLGVNPT